MIIKEQRQQYQEDSQPGVALYIPFTRRSRLAGLYDYYLTDKENYVKNMFYCRIRKGRRKPITPFIIPGHQTPVPENRDNNCQSLV